MKVTRLLLAGAAVLGLLVGLFAPVPTEACPFCSAPSLTLTEQLTQSDACVLVQWVEGEEGSSESAGTTTYEVVEIAKSPKESPLKKGDRITVARYRAGKSGDLFLLMGSKGANIIEWGSPLEVTETSYNYITQAPTPETPTQERLLYFMKFLEFSDPLIANDAYGEFANAPYQDIAPLADKLPREQVRKWAFSPETPATRLGLYGLMIGLCGTEEDARTLEQKIHEQTEEFRLGIDGLMAGYLLLTGDDGLDRLDKQKLADKSVPFSETYAAMQALRFMWEYGDGRIAKERLRQSMRILLDRPELADLVIADLARWEDWSVQERLMKLYGAKEYDIPSIKRAIVRYMLVSTKSKGEGDAAPEHVATGEKYLAQLEKNDPKTVSEAKRFFFLK